MEMGMLHPKYRGLEEEKTGEQLLQEFRARRGRPMKTIDPHEYLAARQAAQSQLHGDDGHMFGISAVLSQGAFSGFSEGWAMLLSIENPVMLFSPVFIL